MLPVVTAKDKTRKNSPKEYEAPLWMAISLKSFPFFRIVLLLPLLSCCCHFYLYQSRLNCFTSTSQNNRCTNLYLYTDLVLLCDICVPLGFYSSLDFNEFYIYMTAFHKKISTAILVSVQNLIAFLLVSLRTN